MSRKDYKTSAECRFYQLSALVLLTPPSAQDILRPSGKKEK